MKASRQPQNGALTFMVVQGCCYANHSRQSHHPTPTSPRLGPSLPFPRLLVWALCVRRWGVTGYARPVPSYPSSQALGTYFRPSHLIE
jgi:hypothetical protein